jgi:signal transduction histidine kinase/CheY-like chemotaxis protein
MKTKNRKQSLIAKIAMNLLVLTIVINIFSIFLINKDIQDYVERYIEEEVTLVLKSLDWAVAPLLEQNNVQNVQRIVEQIGSNSIIEHVSIYDESYKIIFTNDREKLGEIDANDCVVAVLRDRKLKEIYKDRRDVSFKMAIPVRSTSFDTIKGTDIKYVLFVSVDTGYIGNLQQNLKYKFQAIFLFVNIVFIVTILAVIFRYVGIPIKKISDGIHSVYNRDYDVSIDISNSKEFQLMSSFFNDMVSDIKKYTSDLKMEKEKAEIAGKERLKFLARMSHEIRTPLNTVIGFTEILEEDEKNLEKKEQLRIVKRSGKHLLSVINDILDFSKIENESIVLEEIKFDIREEVYLIYEMFDPKAKEKKLKFNILIEEDLPRYFVGDVFRIRQIMINILSNAFKFTQSGFVKMELELNNGKLFIIIEDSGIGIPKENFGIIFDAFKQSDESTTRKFGGTGLGLSISKQLVELMKGHIIVESIVSEGTRFSVELPLPYDNKSNIDVILQASKRKEQFEVEEVYRILVAEDLEDNQTLLKAMLKREKNIELNFVDNGHEALVALRNSKYDLLLLDMQMPVLDGEGVLSELEENPISGLKVIALTANASNEYREKYIELGCDDFMSKPISKNKLKQMIKEMRLSKYKKNHEN